MSTIPLPSSVISSDPDLVAKVQLRISRCTLLDDILSSLLISLTTHSRCPDSIRTINSLNDVELTKLALIIMREMAQVHGRTQRFGKARDYPSDGTISIFERFGAFNSHDLHQKRKPRQNTLRHVRRRQINRCFVTGIMQDASFAKILPRTGSDNLRSSSLWLFRRILFGETVCNAIYETINDDVENTIFLIEEWLRAWNIEWVEFKPVGEPPGDYLEVELVAHECRFSRVARFFKSCPTTIPREPAMQDELSPGYQDELRSIVPGDRYRIFSHGFPLPSRVLFEVRIANYECLLECAGGLVDLFSGEKDLDKMMADMDNGCAVQGGGVGKGRTINLELRGGRPVGR